MAENIRYFCPEYPTNIRKLHPSPATVRARPGRLSALSVFHSESVFYGALVWVHRALNSQKRRFPARADTPASGLHGRTQILFFVDEAGPFAPEQTCTKLTRSAGALLEQGDN